MSEVVGEFRAPCGSPEIESLSLRFLPGSAPIKQRWRNNGLSADFLADYVSTFFPRLEADPSSGDRRAEIAGAVAFIANELLENAMKYSLDSGTSPITITLQLDHERIDIWECNTTSLAQGKIFRDFIERLTNADPEAFYLEQLERNAQGPHSGLGFLTMFNDYAARLAWKFEPGVENTASATMAVTTHVHLCI